MTSLSTSAALHKELECPVCTCVMIDPRVLSCQHTFCLRCLYRMTHKDKSVSVSIRCPFGCEDVTTATNGITSLKKNTVLANLCSAVRTSQFEARDDPDDDDDATDDALEGHHDDLCCDECVTAPATVCCPHCTMFMCAACADDTRGDHTYVCTSSRARGKAGGDGSGSGAYHYPYYVNELSARLHVESKIHTKTAYVPEIVTCRAHYVPCFVESVDASATHENFQVSGRQTIPIYRGRLLGRLQREIEEKMIVPYDCDELVALHEVHEAATMQIEILQQAHNVMTKVEGVLAADHSTAHRVQHVALLLDHCCGMARQCVLPQLRKLALVANVHNVVYVSGLQMRVGRLDQKERGALQKKIADHQEISYRMQSSCTIVQEKLEEIMTLVEINLRTLMQGLRYVMEGDTPIKAPKAAKVEDTETALRQVTHSACELVLHQSRLMSDLTGTVKVTRSEALKSFALEPDIMERMDENAGELDETYFKFHAMIGCTQQFRSLLRMLAERGVRCGASQSRILGPGVVLGVEYFGTEQRDGDNGDDDDDADDAEPNRRELGQSNNAARRSMRHLVARLPDMMDSLEPHIHEIRQQQRELLQRYPDRIEQHLAVQEQLQMVLLQSLDLLERDQALRLREGVQVHSLQARSQLQRLIDALKDSNVDIAVPPEGMELQLLVQTATGVVAQMSRALPDLTRGIDPAGDLSELNRTAKRLFQWDDLAQSSTVRRVVFEGKSGAATSPLRAVTGPQRDDDRDDVGNTSVSRRDVGVGVSESDLNESADAILDMGEGTEAAVSSPFDSLHEFRVRKSSKTQLERYTPDILARIKEICARRFTREMRAVLHGRSPSVAVKRLSTDTTCSYVPFFIGTYRVNGVRRLAGQTFRYVVHGQTGEVFAEYPERELTDLLFELAHVCARSPVLWVIGNVSLVATLRVMSRLFLSDAKK